MPHDETLAHYTFVPWLRRGIASEIAERDTLGSGPGTAVERATLELELELGYTRVSGDSPSSRPVLSKSAQILGPGDVTAIKADAVIRTQPKAGVKSFEANGLAYVDFYEEDFPWRYTPASVAGEEDPADRRHKLRPWIALLVLKADEFEAGVERPDMPASIRLIAERADAALPLETETWAWAHVQLSRAVDDPAGVDGEIRSAPDRALARILAPRRLEPETDYTAFLIPTFETGRLAGLGEDPASIPAQAPSWVRGGMPHSTTRPYEYPVYHQWSFRTAEHGDFESLVRALVPGPVGESFGKRDASLAAPGYGTEGVARPDSVGVEGALQPPGFSREPFPSTPGGPFVDRLETIVDLSEDLERGTAAGAAHPFHEAGVPDAYGPDLPDDPIVTPPAYGKWHADVARVADARGRPELAWLRELNLDPRNRAAAGLGVEVVQERQEELMERSWKQVDELNEANQRMREAELATSVGESMFAKHVALTDGDRLLQRTAAAQRRIVGEGGKTLRSEIQGSRVPLAARSAPFKRASRGQRKPVRNLVRRGGMARLDQDLITRFNADTSSLSAAPPKPEPGVSLAMADVASAVQSSVAEFQSEGARPAHIFLELLVEELVERVDDGEDLGTLSLTNIRSSLEHRLDERIPEGSDPDLMDKKAVVSLLVQDIQAIVPEGSESARVEIDDTRFDASYGTDVGGKSYRGVTVTRSGGAPTGEIAKMTGFAELADFQSNLSSFNTVVSERQSAEPAAPGALGSIPGLASSTVNAMRPRLALASRVNATLPGVTLREPEQPRRLQPVMAHPKFSDPMFADLRQRGQDFIIPNYTELPENTLTLLEPNRRFIEAYMAGLSHEMARELLWREFPTDQRGTYFRTFWDTRDDVQGAGSPDIQRIHEWTGELGAQAARAGGYLALVIRGELLKKYPNTVVYAHRAAWDPSGTVAPRVLADDEVPGNLRFPVLRGDLEPDIAIYGFVMTEEEARGHRPTGPGDPEPPDPGWFFVLRERPGEVNFGLDTGEATPIESWNDLGWNHLTFAGGATHISVNDNALTLSGSPGSDAPTAGIWGKSSADMAYILLQSPVLYARHADDLLP